MDETLWVTVVSAESTARFEDEPIPMQISPFTTPLGPVTITLRTRWSEERYESLVPRELWVDVRGTTAGGLDESATMFVRAADAILTTVAVAANCAIAPPEAKLAFDNTPGRSA